jgi:hypothetical protein
MVKANHLSGDWEVSAENSGMLPAVQLHTDAADRQATPRQKHRRLAPRR